MIVQVPTVEVDDASSWSREEENESILHPRLTPVEEDHSEGEDGSSHHGDPDSEAEVTGVQAGAQMGQGEDAEGTQGAHSKAGGGP